MSTPELSKTPDQSEAYLALYESVVTAFVYLLTSDGDDVDEEEEEAWANEIGEVAWLAFDLFSPQIVSTDFDEATGSKTFVYKMTIPKGDMTELFIRRYELLKSTGVSVDINDILDNPDPDEDEDED